MVDFSYPKPAKVNIMTGKVIIRWGGGLVIEKNMCILEQLIRDQLWGSVGPR